MPAERDPSPEAPPPFDLSLHPPSPPAGDGAGDSASGPPPSRQLWLGDVAPDTTEASLKQTFSRYGNIDLVSVFPTKTYAFVVFRNLEDAIAARSALHSKMRIDFAKPTKPSNQLWIAGIDNSITKEQLEEEFKKFGVLKVFRMLRDRNNAIIEYEKLESALCAVETLNRKQIGNCELHVDFLRSHSIRKEGGPVSSSTHLNERLDFRSHVLTGHSDSVKVTPNLFSPPVVQNRFQASANQTNSTNPVEEASKVLWIGYPASLNVSEELLQRVFILFGEIEHIKMIPGRSFCFVQFRNVDEACRAKVGLQGRLFNDPRVQIRFANHEIIPSRRTQTDHGLLPLRTQLGSPANTERMGFRPPFGVYERPNSMSSPNSFKFPPVCKGPQDDLNAGGCFGPVATSSFFRYDVPNTPNRPSAHVISRGALAPIVSSPIRNLWQTGRHAFDDPNLLDEDFQFRESKRLKTNESQFGVKELHVAPSIGRGPFLGQQHLTNNEAQISGLEIFPSYLNDSQSVVGSQGPNFSVPALAPKLADNSQDAMPGSTWKWQGVVAKAGTVVFRGLCFPVSNAVRTSLPEVVNCFARTDLDTLARYLYPTADFGVISFVPDGDSETQPYKEFLCYLGGKHRAGVAKLDDGTTLFLVPPSDFSVNVLKLHGSSLFGVLLKLPQVGHQHQPPVKQIHYEPKSLTGALTSLSKDQPSFIESENNPGLHGSRSLLRSPHTITRKDQPHGDSDSHNGNYAFSGATKLSFDNLRNPFQSTSQQTAAISMAGGAFDGTFISPESGGLNAFTRVPKKDASQQPHEELDHLVTLLTRQQHSSAHQAVEMGHRLSTHDMQSHPCERLTPSINHMQLPHMEPSSLLQQGSSSTSPFQPSVPVTSEGTSNLALHQTGSLSLTQGSTDSEGEREKRFQATLKLAAALLQSIHKPQDNT